MKIKIKMGTVLTSLANLVHFSIDEVSIGTIVTGVESHKPLTFSVRGGTTSKLRIKKHSEKSQVRYI